MQETANEPQDPTKGPCSSTDGGAECPVRKKLSETTIESASQDIPSDDANVPAEATQETNSSQESSRGRKRSLDCDEAEEREDDSGQADLLNHRRKRSRDNEAEAPAPKADVAVQCEKVSGSDDIATSTQRRKRSRDQVDKDETEAEGTAVKSEEKGPSENGSPLGKAEGRERGKKRQRDESKNRDTTDESKASPVSAFSNASAVSPFGALGSSKAADKSEFQKTASTSASAFASSSIAAFANSEQSPFGSVGLSATSIFKKQPDITAQKQPSITSLAATGGPSPFATAGAPGSGTQKLGFGGFATAAKPGSLANFVSPGESTIFSNANKARPFGLPEEEEGDVEESSELGHKEFEQDKTDKRFFEREIETGEEEERTYFSSKAKLFQFLDKEWRERGVGTFKVNLKTSANEERKTPPRLLMRADGVLRVMLNSPIFKGMVVGDPTGKEPKSRQIHLVSLENDRSIPILLRMPNEELAKELYHVIRRLLDEM